MSAGRSLPRLAAIAEISPGNAAALFPNTSRSPTYMYMHRHFACLHLPARRRTIGLAVHDDGGPALRVGGSLLHGSDGALPDAVGLGGEAGGGGAEGGGRSQEAGSNKGGELHCCCGMYWVP